MTSLHEHFNDFIEARLVARNEAFTRNKDYSGALAFLEQCPLNVHQQAVILSDVGKEIAYRLGFQDGLIFMAESMH